VTTSNDSYLTLFEANPQPMLVFDTQTLQVLSVNEAAVLKYGYTKAELLSMTVDVIFPAASQFGRLQLSHRTKSGETFDAEVIQSCVRFECRDATLVISPDVTERRQADAELSLRYAVGRLIATDQRVEFQARLLDQVNGAIVTVDRTFTITYWNGAAERIFARKAQDVVGKKYEYGVCTVLSDDARAAIYAEILQEGVWKGELPCVAADGRQIIANIWFSVLRDSDGSVQGAVGIHRDVTGSRQMEDQLRATESRLQLAQTAFCLGIWELDLKTGVAQWSKELFQLFGLPDSTGGMTLQEWSERIHPADREFVVREALAAPSGHENPEHQYRIIWPDGSIHWLRTKITAVLDAKQRPVKLIGVDFDITELREAQRSNAELATIVEFASLAIFSTSMEGNILTWNSGAEQIFGYSAVEAVGSPVQMLAAEDHCHEHREIGDRLHQRQKTNHLETVCVTKGGEQIQVLMSAAPILSRSGSVVGGAYILWDITQIKLLQRQLSQAQKLESIGHLAAGIAHEINTPIQYIGDNAQFLEEGFRDLLCFVEPSRQLAEALRTEGKTNLIGAWEEAVRNVDVDYLQAEFPQAIGQLLEGVHHVARIVSAMKEFSHPGPMEMRMADINHAIDCTALVSKNEWKYVADLTTDLAPNLPPVPCLVGEFNQVILNLIVNAAHAIHDVVGETGQRGSILISTRQVGRCVEIRVADTGAGIPEAIHSKIFDPFFTTKDVGKGTGQGLAIAHAVVVQKHGGSIRFETKPGIGTTFIIDLPLKTVDEAA
jgi:PAS domain S-box-containing protein